MTAVQPSQSVLHDGLVTHRGGDAADVLIEALQADRAGGQLRLPGRRCNGGRVASSAGNEVHVPHIQQPAYNLRLQRGELHTTGRVVRYLHQTGKAGMLSTLLEQCTFIGVPRSYVACEPADHYTTA